jgi:hypothetical protein
MTIACTLTDDDRATRRLHWERIGREGYGGIVKTPTGLQLVVRSSLSVRTALVELAQLERECCAFATWTVRDEGSRLVLDV